MESLIPVLKSAVTIMIPVFYAALGGLFPALAGSLNIALEGLLLTGAFSSLAVYYFSGSAAAAVLCAVISSMALSAIHILTVYKLKADLFICGLAVNLLSVGMCIVLSDKLFGTKGVVALNGAPMLSNFYITFGIILLIISWIAVYKTPFGYRLRACGKNSQSLVSLGINPKIYQSSAVLLSGFFCGIGGSFLSLNLGAYVPGMSAGKGWIALAVIFLGMKKPAGVLAAAFIFALAESLSNFAQGSLQIPADFILAFPYICTLTAMILVSLKTTNLS
ncbi:MAG: ABC transporter permease [Treponema sp.]|nr:ABC transporter permease [Treponema sp.]MCL2267185.1 ABC transporter permease [Treponema sp.]